MHTRSVILFPTLITVMLLTAALSFAPATQQTAAYSTGTPTDPTLFLTLNPPAGPTRERIERAEADWQALDISDYAIQIEYISVWGGYDVHTTVINNLPARWYAEGFPGMMPGTFGSIDHLQPRDYTVEGLFALADGQASRPWIDMRFHPTYHFPTAISYNDPEVADGEWGLTVTLFSTAITTGPPPFSESGIATATQIARDQATPVSSVTPAPTAVPTITPGGVIPPFDNQLPEWIDAAEANWQALDIMNYALEIRERGAWTGMTASLEVRDGLIVSFMAACQPGPASSPGDSCWLQDFTAREYTIPGLFDLAHEVASIPRPMFDPLEFDATYHFPTAIHYDDLDMADEEWSVRVRGFTPQ